jgi:parallel beta-helix repeat protein
MLGRNTMKRPIVLKGFVVAFIGFFLGIAVASSISANAVEDEMVEITTNSSHTDGDTLYVGGSGPGNYSTIQSAIDNASDGDLIYIYAGTYYEPLTLRKSLTLQGQDANTTIIDGCQAFSTLYVNTTEFHIRSLGFRNTSRRDIWIEIASNSSIIDCRFMGNLIEDRFGIRPERVTHLLIRDCYIVNYADGIEALYTTDSSIEHCVLSNRQRSVSINDGCRNCRVANCTIIGQPQSDSGNRGLDIYGQYNLIINCNIFNCTEGIFLDGNNSSVINCTVSNCSWRGIFCGFGSHDHLIKQCTITGCGFAEQAYAIETWDSNNTIDGCIIKDNPGGGVEFQWPGGYNTLSRSTLIHNGYGSDTEGFRSISHLPNYIYLNTFSDNNIQARDYYQTCTFDNGILGNYWSDYNGLDWNHDFIGTQPYNLYDNSNTDNFPLICPYNPNGPSVLLERPAHLKGDFLYIRNLRILRFPSTILIGGISIKARAVTYDNPERITKVEFYVDGILRKVDILPPYTWCWWLSSPLNHKHIVNVIAYDSKGKVGQDSCQVYKLL